MLYMLSSKSNVSPDPRDLSTCKVMSMTSGTPNTRDAILTATKALVESTSFADVSLARVAADAGVSRQAVYLHFGSRTGLLLALVAWMDETGRLRSLMDPVLKLDDPAEVLLGSIAAATAYNADVAAVSLALREARRSDEAAAAAWNDLRAARIAAIRSVVTPVANSGGLRPGRNVRLATDMIYAMISPTMYEDLVIDRKWSQRRYTDHVVRLVRGMLAGDPADE